MSASASAVAPPLSEALRTRGRRLAIASHPAGNTFRMVFSQHLPTLALVGLGASELEVGLQNAFVFAFIALQLPTLRAVSRFSKRSILLASHAFALLAALPLVFWSSIEALPGATPVAVAMASFAFVAMGLCVGETVWFPLLRGFVEPERIGRFFGTLRTGWHLALILFYAGSQRWLEQHPGGFGALFATGWALGLLRTFLIARLPERSERTGERIRARQALALVRDPRMRGYLLTVAWTSAVRVAAIPFAIVMMRRVAGVSGGDVLYTTVAYFSGGLVSLYLWGRVVDRAGAVPVLRATLIGQALVIAALAGFEPGASAVPVMVVWFFAVAVLASGFGVADTHLLFGLAPAEAPARTLVLGAVVVGIAAGLTPIGAGAVLDAALGGGHDLAVYRAFFGSLGGLALLALIPLRGLRRTGVVCVLAWLGAVAPGGSARAADQIHWTITGQTAVSFDWRGTAQEDFIRYGTASGSYSDAVIAAAPTPLPFSSAGPFWEAQLTNLAEDTLYFYSIADGPEHSFRTPRVRGDAYFTVYAEADIGETTSYSRMGPVQDLIAAGAPSFVLAAGDLSYGNSHGQASVDQHFDDVMPWSRDAAYMPAWGNHEWDSSGDDLRNYKGRFDLPNSRASPGSPAISCCGEDWSWFDYGNARFIAYPEPWSGAWADWSVQADALMDAAELDPELDFVVTWGHRPAYSSGHHPGSSTLASILDALGADHPKYKLNLNGHSHDYERSYPQSGVVHLTVGTGGSTLEIDGACLWLTCNQPAWSAFRAMRLGALRLDFSSDAIQGAFLCGPASSRDDIDCTPGEVVDRFRIAAGTRIEYGLADGWTHQEGAPGTLALAEDPSIGMVATIGVPAGSAGGGLSASRHDLPGYSPKDGAFVELDYDSLDASLSGATASLDLALEVECVDGSLHRIGMGITRAGGVDRFATRYDAAFLESDVPAGVSIAEGTLGLLGGDDQLRPYFRAADGSLYHPFASWDVSALADPPSCALANRFAADTGVGASVEASVRLQTIALPEPGATPGLLGGGLVLLALSGRRRRRDRATSAAVAWRSRGRTRSAGARCRTRRSRSPGTRAAAPRTAPGPRGAPRGRPGTCAGRGRTRGCGVPCARGRSGRARRTRARRGSRSPTGTSAPSRREASVRAA